MFMRFVVLSVFGNITVIDTVVIMRVYGIQFRFFSGSVIERFEKFEVVRIYVSKLKNITKVSEYRHCLY